MAYEMNFDRLDVAVAMSQVEPTHGHLMKALRLIPSLEQIRLLTHRGDAWLSRRKVLSEDGQLIHDDHEAWLKGECAKDAGNFAQTARRLRALDHRLTECAVDTLYLVQDRGSARHDDFIQLKIVVEDETIERRLFASQGVAWRDSAQNFHDLVEEAEDGERFDVVPRTRYGQPSYRLRSCIDVGAFLSEAAALKFAQREASRSRSVVVTDKDGRQFESSVGELDPDGVVYAWKGQRLIYDWALSSAGRAGHQFCEHWALEISDCTLPDGSRDMNVVPLWFHTRKMAALSNAPKSDYELFGKLEATDRRVGVCFGWYFYMLHGNLIKPWVGERVLLAAEAGKIVLPEHDYQVLKRWSLSPYGF